MDEQPRSPEHGVRYLSIEEIEELHRNVMLSTGQLPQHLRSEHQLASAVDRPRVAAYYEGASTVRQAALLAAGIAQPPAFVDGNKRTAYVAVRFFLDANGYSLTVAGLELARQVVRLAERSVEVGRERAEEEFTRWLETHVVPT